MCREKEIISSSKTRPLYLDIANFWLQDTPITALIRPVSLNDTICLQSCKMFFDSFRCDPYDFSEFPRRVVGMFLEDLDNPLPTFLLFLPTNPDNLPTFFH